MPEDLRDLESARPRGQTSPTTIERTAGRLRRLEAWIGEQPETAWQTGGEARITISVSAAQALAETLPRGPLRDHLLGNQSAAIVFGALNETAPRTAAARMQTMWEAWTRSPQDVPFSEFADSSLVEAGVTELRAAGQTALADALAAEPAVQNAFGRLGYDAARLRAVYQYYEQGYSTRSGTAGLSFPEYARQEVGSLEGGGRSWAERRGSLAASSIPAAGFDPLRTRLADLTTAGTLTDVDARIVWRWNAIIEALVTQSAARVPGAEAGTPRATAVLNYLLEGMRTNFSESVYRNFRHRMRGLMVDDVIYIRDGDTSTSPATHDGTPVRAWADQLTRLEAWEGRVPSGDSASIGALWTAYSTARFQMGLPTGSTVAGIETVPGRNLRMTDGRMGDAVLRFGRRTDPTAPDTGEYAADYKGGTDPHNIEQSRNYSANMTANGGSFVMGGRSYRGLLLIFRSSTAADAAARALNAEGLHANLKVGYFSGTTGAIIWVR